MRVINDRGSTLNTALEYNSYDGGEEIDTVEPLAVIHGENDESNWHWLVKTNSGNFMYITGGCDYTGWDCQSSLHFGQSFKSLEDANLTIPGTDNRNRKVRDILVAQAVGLIPYGSEELKEK